MAERIDYKGGIRKKVAIPGASDKEAEAHVRFESDTRTKLDLGILVTLEGNLSNGKKFIRIVPKTKAKLTEFNKLDLIC